jgi:VanZ family protein
VSALRDEKGKAAFFWWTITIGYMGLIFFLSSQSTIELRGVPENTDKVLHLLAYIPLAFLLYHALLRSGGRRYVFLGAFVIASVYGLTDELHQVFVPGRIPDFFDLMADSAGAFLGSGGAHLGVKRN